MKGWMFVTTEGYADFRDDKFLADCPSFFSDNRDSLLRTWRIDTDDLSVMMNAFTGWKTLGPKNHEVTLFCTRIGFDISRLTEHANKLRQG